MLMAVQGCDQVQYSTVQYSTVQYLMLAVQGCDPGAAVCPPATLATGGPGLCTTSALPHCAKPELETVS